MTLHRERNREPEKQECGPSWIRKREEERYNYDEEWSKKAIRAENGKETEQVEGRGGQVEEERWKIIGGIERSEKDSSNTARWKEILVVEPVNSWRGRKASGVGAR